MAHFFIYILLGSTLNSIGVNSCTNSLSFFFFFSSLLDEVFSLFPDQFTYLPKTSWHFIPSQHGTVPSKWGQSLDVWLWHVNINAQKRWTISITDGQEGIRHKLVTGLITIHKYNRHDDTHCLDQQSYYSQTVLPKVPAIPSPVQSHNKHFKVFLLMASTWYQVQVNRKTKWKSWRKCRRHGGWMLQQSTSYT